MRASDIATLITAIATLLAAIATLIGVVRASGKVAAAQEELGVVHAKVNGDAHRARAREDQLVAALTGAGLPVPPAAPGPE